MSARAFTNMPPNTRRMLYQQAMQASIRTRTQGGNDLKSPICIYALCRARGVIVRFNAINMEGIYDRVPRPRIHLSALRPLVRRTFNCAHELGHHEFGHGSAIDELRDDASIDRWNQPNELLADTFAAFTLMPALGMREAFARRRLIPERATPTELYAIACNFGVGLSTLTTHMALGMEAISPFRRAALARHTPRSIRTEFLGCSTTEPLILVDEEWNAPSIDAEEGYLIWLPTGVQVTGKVLIYEHSARGGSLFRAIAPGIGRAFHPNGSWATFVRVIRREYVGLAEYRHLEDTTDD